MYKKSIFKKSTAAFLCVVMSAALSGCDLIPTLKLTQEESHIIAEYSAGLLLKYDRNYKGTLSELKEEDDKLEVVGDIDHSDIAEEASESPENMPDGNDKKKNNEQQYSDIPMAEALGLSGFDVSYSGMETAYIYPEETDEMVFSMQAQQGMELLVMHFNLTNATESNNLCDVLANDAMFRIIINGSERIPSQHTILMNDLSQYHEDIAGYGMVDSVLIFEAAEGTSSNIETLDLIINQGGSNSTYKIL